MAAMYTGIYQKLKSHQTPWSDKLKLARFAWVSRKCFFPNKEQVLLDWTAIALSGYYSKKVEVTLEVVEGLWTYLDDVLHSKSLNHILSQGKNITLNPAITQVINERILESTSGTLSVSLSTILSCCCGILNSPVLSVSYTAKYDVLVNLLMRVCNLACSQLSQQESAQPLSFQVFEVLLRILSTYLTVQRQQGNSNRVFSQVTEHLLHPLCFLRHLLTTRQWTDEDDVRIRQHLNKDIRSKVDTILQSALFYHDRLPYYKDEVLLSKQESGVKKGSTGGTFLSPVTAILSKFDHRQGSDKEALFYAVTSNSLPLFFKFSIDSFCKEEENKLVCFHIMTKFFPALDFTEDLAIKETFNPANWSLVLLFLENILNTCLAGDLYNVAADRIHHGEVQLHFFRKVAQMLLNNAQTDIPAWYRCLKVLLALNHQILEPDMDELLSSAWVDADNMELRVKKARESLVCAVLQTYAKLRQLPRLIEQLLVVITRPAADELRQELLPEALQKSLSQLLLDNPPSQNVDICRLILEKMQNNVPYVNEMRKESALKLFSLSVLLHAVIFSLKTLDNSTPVPTVRQTQSLMEDVLTLVRSLIKCTEGVLNADSVWGEKIQEVILLLAHTWHEADALFQIHCSKYTSPAGPSSDLSSVDKISAIQVRSPLCRLLQKLLALHKIKKHMFMSPLLTLDEDTKQILCETVQYVVNGQESLMNPSVNQTWDLQLCSVNSDTYSVAYWFLITTNLHLIAPYLSQEDTSYIADTMVSSLLQDDLGSHLNSSDLTVFLISKQLLQSVVLCELPNLHSAVVTSLTNRFVRVLCASGVQSLCPSFFKSDCEFGAESVGHITEISPPMRRLKAIAQEIMNCVETGIFIPLSETDMGHLLHLVNITSVLNPHVISNEDYLELFLSSFLVNLCVQQDGNGSLSAPVSVLKELFGLMAVLLMRQNSHTVLKVVHGSMLLEAAMTCVFSCFRKDLFQNVDSSAWFTILQSIQGFIQTVLQLIINRKRSVIINLEKFTKFMIERATAVGTSVESGECQDALYTQLHIATLSTLCKEMIPVFGKNQQLDGSLTQLLDKIISVMGSAVQHVLTGKAGSVLRQSFSVEVVTVMIKSELAKSSQLTQDSPEGDGRDKICHMGLYKSFGQQILKNLCAEPQPMDYLISSVHYLSGLYLACEKTKETDVKDLHFEILKSVYKLLSSSWLSVSDVKELEAPVKDLLDQFMVNCSLEQFHLLFNLLRDELVASRVGIGYHTEVLASLTVIKLLSCCSLSVTCSKAFWCTVPQILSAIVFVIRESSEVASLTGPLTVPAVETMTTLLCQGKSQLSDPHHVILGFGGLQFVPLDSQCKDDYYSAFQAIHEALFAIILYYPQVMLKAAPTFLNCFYRLVSSIIHEGRQKGEKESEKSSEMLLKCAMLVERMYTHISSTSEGLTVLFSFIVAQYVSELPKVTLQPEIKAHLTEGIYRILDHCFEQDIKFLNVTLQKGVKEVFSELYKNYVHYHKSQMQGEEKYTA